MGIFSSHFKGQTPPKLGSDDTKISEMTCDFPIELTPLEKKH